MELKNFISLLTNATDIGAQKALDASGVVKETICKSEAYSLYGRANVDRWILEGLIVPLIANGKTPYQCIDRLKLEAVAHSSNRITYLPVAER